MKQPILVNILYCLVYCLVYPQNVLSRASVNYVWYIRKVASVLWFLFLSKNVMELLYILAIFLLRLQMNLKINTNCTYFKHI